MYNDEINRYQNSHVRDLAWALLSPPLMQYDLPNIQWSDSAWYQQHYKESREWLEEIDRAPQDFVKQLKPWPQARLGDYYESLWAAWIRMHPRYELLHQNKQIIVNGITKGEFDFIVRDVETNRVGHWEVAVKFYLGYDDLKKQSAWYGLQFRDRLDIKINRMIDHQCQLSQHGDSQVFLADNHLKIDDIRVILKGRLFYPVAQNSHQGPEHANSNHLRSTWCEWPLFCEDLSHQEGTWKALVKSDWFAPLTKPSHTHSLVDIIKLVDSEKIKLPICMAQFDNKLDEIKRLFVTPETWAVPDTFK